MTKKQSAAGIICLVTAMLLLIACPQKEIPKPIGTGAIKPPNNKKKSAMEKRLLANIKDRHITKVIMASKRPYLYAGLAEQESRYKPQAIGKAGEFGLFQIRKSIHGQFDDRLESQLAKCESILEPLIAKHGLEDALRRYNGTGEAARRYAKSVLRRSARIRLTNVDT